MAGVLRFNHSQAEAILERFRGDMERNLMDANMEYANNYGSSGYAEEITGLVDAYIPIVDAAGYDGTIVTAQALEAIEGAYSSPLNELRMFIIEYVEMVDTPNAREYTERKNAEYEQNITEIRVAMDNEISEIMDALDAEEEERRRREEEEERKRKEREERQRKREERRREKERLENEYKKARDRLQSQIRRREKAGVDVDIDIPDIPRDITQGSINRLEHLIERVQNEYGYIRWKGSYRTGK